jgi:hypothetical protein
MDKETKKFIKTEVEELAAMVQRGFNDVNKRFEAVGQRFDRLEREMQDVKTTVERIDRRTQNQVDAMYERTLDHGRRIRLIEDKLGIDPKELKTIELGS